MKIEIEKSEYDRLKSREEKLMAYYEWYVYDKENDLSTVEDIINKNIELEEENEKLREENKKLSEENGQLKEEIETLELRLDNKEKLNEEYRKQLDKLRTDNIYEE